MAGSWLPRRTKPGGVVDDVKMMAEGFRWGRRPQVPRSAEPYVVRTEKPVFPTGWSRTRPAKVAREVAQKGMLKPVFNAQVRPHVEGLEQLEKVEGPVVFVANHSSHLDTPLILLALPDSWRRRTAVAAAADYFFDTAWKAVVSSIFFNTFPIERRGGAMDSTPGDVLDDGWSLVVFPEGTRSPDGWLGRFRLGAAWLAVEHRVPVVPVAVRGTYHAMPRGAGWPSGGRPAVTVRFGTPLLPGHDVTVRDFAPQVRDAVARLLDEDTSTWWESEQRAARGETPEPAGDTTMPGWRRVWDQTQPPVIASADGRRRPGTIAGRLRAWRNR